MASSETPGPRKAASDERAGRNAQSRHGRGIHPAHGLRQSDRRRRGRAAAPRIVPTTPIARPSSSNMRMICRRVAPIARNTANCRRRSPTFIKNVLRIVKNASTIISDVGEIQALFDVLDRFLGQLRPGHGRADGQARRARPWRSSAATVFSSAPSASTTLIRLTLPALENRFGRFQRQKDDAPLVETGGAAAKASP